VPVVVRRNNQRHETLVRLMGNIATEKETAAPKGETPRPDPKTPAPAPKTGANPEAAKMYVTRKGYANWYFNQIERDKLLAEAKKHGDFTSVGGAWSAEGKYEVGERKGDLRFEITEGKGDADPLVNLKLNIDHRLSPLKDTDARIQAEPIGSGGLMLALYHWHRFLTLGPKGFEGLFAHGGHEPFYPYPSDGSTPKSLASLRVDCAVLRTKHGSTDCKWYFSLKDHTLLGFETFISKDEDPCELYFADYKPVDGRMLPHRIEIRHKDKRYGVFTVGKYNLGKS
jgi:hypothetical protein